MVKTVVEVFDLIAGDWNEKHHKARAWVALFKKFLEETDVVLDAGCGNGINSIELAPLVKKIYAIDASPRMVSFAKENVAKASLNEKVEVSEASVLSLPFEDSQFDVAAYFAVVHHFDKPAEWKKLFSEANRVLKKNGLAFVTVWNKVNADERMKLATKSMFINFKKKTGEELPRLYYLFDRSEIEKLAEDSGFAVEEVFFEESGKMVSEEKCKNLCMVLKKL